MHYLNGLGYVHFVNLNLWEATSGNIFIFLVIAIEKVGGIHSNADGSLGRKQAVSRRAGSVELALKQSARASDLTGGQRARSARSMKVTVQIKCCRKPWIIRARKHQFHGKSRLPTYSWSVHQRQDMGARSTRLDCAGSTQDPGFVG